jgi:hypothetical protein
MYTPIASDGREAAAMDAHSRGTGKPRDVVKIDSTPRLDIAFDDLHHAQTR